MNCTTVDLGGLQLAVVIVASCIGYAIVRLTNSYIRRKEP